MEVAPAAHRIPEEILIKVIEFLKDDYEAMSQAHSFTYTLVCRYWALSIRPTLFSKIQIRGEAHLNRLILLLTTPSVVIPSLANTIVEINLQDTGKPQKPWIHRVPSIHTLIRPGAKERAMRVDDKGVEPWVSIHGDTPRTLPLTKFRFSQLFFFGPAIRRVQDLLRIVRGLPELVELYLQQVSFSDGTFPPEAASHISVTKVVQRPNTVSNLTFEHCDAPNIDMRRLALTLCDMYRRRFTSLDEQHWQIFQQMFALFPDIKFSSKRDIIFLSTFSDTVRCSHRLKIIFELSKHSGVEVTLQGRRAWKIISPMLTEWNSVATSFLDIFPTPSQHRLELALDHTAPFKHAIDAVVHQDFLQPLHALGQVDVTLVSPTVRGETQCSMREILALPAEHEVDGVTLSLKASQQFELSILESEEERAEYLRNLTLAGQAASPTGRDTEPSDTDGEGDEEGLESDETESEC